MVSPIAAVAVLGVLALAEVGHAFAFAPPSLVADHSSTTALCHSRRDFVATAATLAVGAASGAVSVPSPVRAADVDTENFLKTGQVAMPMGVSGQAGKAKPVTGVVLRDGSEVSQDGKGNVLAEILVGKPSDPVPVLATFSSPWSLAKGGLFDVETRDAKTGDGAFLTVSPGGGKSLAELPKTFFTEKLFANNGRFSFYGAPTDVRVKKSEVEGPYRYLEIAFSNLSQSTNAEIPRTALVAATIPEGADGDVVMLVGSATSNRWKRGAEGPVRATVGSFRAARAPASGMKVRAKKSASEL